MQRYIVEGNIENIIFDERDIFHIFKVMRHQVGDEIEINLNGKIYSAQITSKEPFSIKVTRIIDENRELKNNIVLYYCLPKGDKINLVLQKCTELGVKSIYGVTSKRTVVKIESSDKPRKIERFQRIMKEASEQSKRTEVPEFIDIIDYKQIFNKKYDHMYIADEHLALQNIDLFNELTSIEDNESISIIVGAEGGFSEEEISLANEKGYKGISLGKRILRSETAAIYIMSVLSFVLERNIGK